MSKKQTNKQLWRQIGIEDCPISSSIIEREGSHSLHQEPSLNRSSVLSATKQPDEEVDYIRLNHKECSFDVSRQKSNPHPINFRDALANQDIELVDVEDKYQPVQFVEDFSQVEQVIRVSKSSSTKKEDYEAYNQEIGEHFISVTPLVYSKNTKIIDQGIFRRQQAQIGLLKYSVSQSQRAIRQLKIFIKSAFSDFSRFQAQLTEQMCSAYQQLQKVYSMKAQESIFNKKQEFEQLKYDFETLKGKQQVTRTPIKSEFMIADIEVSDIYARGAFETERLHEIIKQNQWLKQKVATLQSQKYKLTRQANHFKSKIAGIQTTTMQVRESNDKLYECIFDLEQKLAFQEEEIPKMTKQIREELQNNFNLQVKKIEDERKLIKQKMASLEVVYQQKKKIQEQLEKVELQLTDLKIQLANRGEQIESLTKLCCKKDSEMQQLIKKQGQQNIMYKQIIEEKDQIIEAGKSLKSIKESPRTSRVEEMNYRPIDRHRQTYVRQIYDFKQAQDRKAKQALQIEKLVLQKENLHLKATLQFYNKNPNFITQPPVSPRQTTAYSIENHYLSSPTDVNSPISSNLLIKERELTKYQSYLDAEAKRLEEKQRELEIQSAVRKTREKIPRQNTYTHEKIYDFTSNQDDYYGMKSRAAITAKTYNNYPSHQHRKNNFCSSEAQAIIEKVKQKQQRRSNLSCNSNCENSGYCRCDVNSKESRGSRDSCDRNYLRLNVRAHNPSPSARIDDYVPYRQKSSKMKLIEDKVNRLKSQLKNSLTSMQI